MCIIINDININNNIIINIMKILMKMKVLILIMCNNEI